LVTTLAKAPTTGLDMLLVDWDLLPVDLGVSPWLNCVWLPECHVVVLNQHWSCPPPGRPFRRRDAFISKGETPSAWLNA